MTRSSQADQTQFSAIASGLRGVRQRLLIAVAIIAVAVTLCLTFLSLSPVLRQLLISEQTPSFLWLNGKLQWFRAPFWTSITSLGDATVLLPLCSLFVVYRPAVWAGILSAVPVSGLMSLTMKALLEFPRPAAALSAMKFNTWGEVLNGHNSLPSGHTITAFAVSTVIILMACPTVRSAHRSWYTIAIGTPAILVGLSRIAVGAHWPLDILAGALCGVIGGVSGAAIASRHSTWWSWLSTAKLAYLTYLPLLGFVSLLLWQVYREPQAFNPSILLGCVFAAVTSLVLIGRHARHSLGQLRQFMNQRVSDVQ